MLQRLYAHNYKCLENFEMVTKHLSSALLIGKNGVGKSTIRSVLEIFQKIGRGQNRVRELAPIPTLMNGTSAGETLEPELTGTNFGEWFSGVLSRYPAAYTTTYEYLNENKPQLQHCRQFTDLRGSQ